MDQFPRQLLVGWARRKSSLLALCAFGSRTRGTASETSDLDLAVEIDGNSDSALLHFVANRAEMVCRIELAHGPPNSRS